MSFKITSQVDLDRALDVADIIGNFEFNNMSDIYDDSIRFNNEHADRKIFNTIGSMAIPKAISAQEDADNFQKSLCKKMFLDIMTEFVNSEKIYNDKNIKYIARFQYAVNKVFSKAIDTYRKNFNYYLRKKDATATYILKESDLFFCYKGGTTMKILFTEFSEKIFKPMPIYKKFESYFKRSDSDYSVFINPKLPVKIFNIVYYDVNKIVTLCLLKITKIFSENMDFFCPVNLIQKTDIYNQLNKMNTKLEEVKKNPTDYPYCNHMNKIEKIIGMSYLNKFYMLEQIPALSDANVDLSIFGSNDDSALKKEFIGHSRINPQKGNMIVSHEPDTRDFDKILRKPIAKQTYIKQLVNPLASYSVGDKNDIYISINETGEILEKKFHKIMFCLQRAKINFVTYYKTVDGKYGYLHTPAELIDVSIMKRKSGDLANVYEHEELEFEKYAYDYIAQDPLDYNLKIKFKSYSIYGHISDLCNILFKQEEYPWNDKKYDKRLCRLMFFMLLELFSSSVLDYRKIRETLLYFKTITNHVSNIAIDEPITDFKTRRLPFKEEFENLEMLFSNFFEQLKSTNIYRTDSSGNLIEYASGITKVIDGYLMTYNKINFDVLKCQGQVKTPDELEEIEKIKKFISFNNIILEILNNVLSSEFLLEYLNTCKLEIPADYMKINMSNISSSVRSAVDITSSLGGSYYKKYLKYKAKYLKLKTN